MRRRFFDAIEYILSNLIPAFVEMQCLEDFLERRKGSD